ncbi:MAG: hypothetical protein N3A71_02820 [Candidatus Dojkabacteria bacterium]|nr:hypothetical protein [Candidatus Dojkabacteria bacterium]
MSEAKYIKINVVFLVIFFLFLLFLTTSNISHSKSSAYVETQYSTILDEVNDLIRYVENKYFNSQNKSEEKYIYSDCLIRLKKIKELIMSKNSHLSNQDEKVIRHKIICIINELKNLESSHTKTYIYTQI